MIASKWSCLPKMPRERSKNGAFFCSARCKMIDLGAWFGEQRSLPAEDQGDGLIE
ncbi:DNA gyrase inhibitor YacG [Sinimarinibacterium sp. NLF-5-8]|nr:DNA gyrase inhibitor YacG [Sinimarinibacterium sp. NLF-5-8]